MGAAPKCDHPPVERWQCRGLWRCCKCFAWFWGDKREAPITDIYGRDRTTEAA